MLSSCESRGESRGESRRRKQRLKQRVKQSNVGFPFLCFSALVLPLISFSLLLSLSFFPSQELLPAVLITRLSRLLVHGNPLCGPTGSDPSGSCVDRVISASIEARDGWGDTELTIVTATGDAPPGKKGGRRRALYKDLQMSAVLDDGVPTAAEFRRAGNRALNVVGLQPAVSH